MNKQVEVKVFVGAVSNPTFGNWVTLPMKHHELESVINGIFHGRSIEVGIMDLDTEMKVDFGRRYTNPYLLNSDLKLFQVYEERGELSLLMTAYAFCDGDLENAIDFLETGNYEYYEDVTDVTSLGEAAVACGKLGWFMGKPDAYENMPEVKRMQRHNMLQLKAIAMYLDFESIGHDMTCNGCRIYGDLKTAMMETRKN